MNEAATLDAMKRRLQQNLPNGFSDLTVEPTGTGVLVDGRIAVMPMMGRYDESGAIVTRDEYENDGVVKAQRWETLSLCPLWIVTGGKANPVRVRDDVAGWKNLLIAINKIVDGVL